MIQTVLASYFTSIPDPLPDNIYRQHVFKNQIDNRFWSNDYSSLLPLIDSVINNKSRIIIFHDCFDRTPYINGCTWVKVSYNKIYAPTIYRWFVYYDYLKKNKYDNIFMVDSTDVIMLKNIEIVKNILYCGTEYRDKFCTIDQIIKKLQNITLPDFKDIFVKYNEHILLNAGIIGGTYDICFEFLEKLTYYHNITSQNIEISLDMPIFNYVLLKHFKDKLSFGSHVNTRFGKYEYNNISAWKHK